VSVASFASRPLAELARSYLEDQGVPAAVDADDGNGTQPEVGFVTGGARVVVAPGAVDRARALLAEVEDTSPRAPRRRSRGRRWVAALVAGTMLALGVWTTLVVLLF
jgi:hypothetical protein